jgi:hypothetical protein
MTRHTALTGNLIAIIAEMNLSPDKAVRLLDRVLNVIESDELTVIEAAALACTTPQTIRNWSRRFGIGERRGRDWFISRRKLTDLLLKRFNRLPAPLADLCLDKKALA